MNKAKIHHHLSELVQGKKNDLEKMISDLRSSNNETKSSMGDKYETSREMLQQEINRLQNQLKIVHQQLDILHQNEIKTTEKIEKGSLVQTDLGYFYISVAYGKFAFEDKMIFAISEESPLSKAMIGLKKGEKINLSTQAQHVKNIW